MATSENHKQEEPASVNVISFQIEVDIAGET